VVGVDRAQYRLIAAQAPEEIRSAAVASIRAASALDENLQQLQQALPEDADAAELMKLNETMREPRMAIIQAAKQNDDARRCARPRRSRLPSGASKRSRRRS